jgi:hypothetical protein
MAKTVKRGEPRKPLSPPRDWPVDEPAAPAPQPQPFSFEGRYPTAKELVSDLQSVTQAVESREHATFYAEMRDSNGKRAGFAAMGEPPSRPMTQERGREHAHASIVFEMKPTTHEAIAAALHEAHDLIVDALQRKPQGDVSVAKVFAEGKRKTGSFWFVRSK